MKVKVSYTMGLEEVPDKICSMLKSGSDNLEEVAQSLCSLPVLLKRKESFPALLLHLDELRKEMAQVDNQLSEAVGMLEGLVEHHKDALLPKEPSTSAEVEYADKDV